MDAKKQAHSQRQNKFRSIHKDRINEDRRLKRKMAKRLSADTEPTRQDSDSLRETKRHSRLKLVELETAIETSESKQATLLLPRDWDPIYAWMKSDNEEVIKTNCDNLAMMKEKLELDLEIIRLTRKKKKLSGIVEVLLDSPRNAALPRDVPQAVAILEASNHHSQAVAQPQPSLTVAKSTIPTPTLPNLFGGWTSSSSSSSSTSPSK